MAKLAIRPARSSEHGFLVSRTLGELRRARLDVALIARDAPSIVRALLRHPDVRTAVIDAGGPGVLIGGAVGFRGGVLCVSLPTALRPLEVRDEMLVAIGAGERLPDVRWLVPVPWWTRRYLQPVYDPFTLLLQDGHAREHRCSA